ncbi:MAG: hypothetical protein ACFCUW_16290 [Kiloniellaceae bacterium]
MVEENVILALDLEDTLKRNGALRVDIVGSCEEALRAVEAVAYNLALLDLKLLRSGLLPLAARLVDLGIPFAFSNGHGERSLLPPPYTACPLVSRPCSETYLLSSLAKVMTARPHR